MCLPLLASDSPTGESVADSANAPVHLTPTPPLQNWPRSHTYYNKVVLQPHTSKQTNLQSLYHSSPSPDGLPLAEVHPSMRGALSSMTILSSTPATIFIAHSYVKSEVDRYNSDGICFLWLRPDSTVRSNGFILASRDGIALRQHSRFGTVQGYNRTRVTSAALIRTLFFLFFLHAALPIDAAFTRSARWKLDFVEQTNSGSWCYRPGASPTSDDHCGDLTLKMMLNTHIKNDHGPGLTIAYYDTADGSALGGPGWADWDTVALPVGVCMSGQVDGVDNAYATICRFTIADNDHDTPASHVGECAVNRAQLRVADGCYTPPPRRSWFRFDDPTNAILAIISLILALPTYGLYRWYRRYRARQQARTGNEQAQPLIPLGSGTVDDDLGQDSPRPEARIDE